MEEIKKAALMVGINDYYHFPKLNACVNDVINLKKVLRRNSDNTLNFATTALVSSPGEGRAEISSRLIQEKVRAFFNSGPDIALFYFAGHGFIDGNEGFLVGETDRVGSDGFRMGDLLRIVNESRIPERIVILDCCHAGQIAACIAQFGLACGVSILVASRSQEAAVENDGIGKFTDILCYALDGGAANVMGKVTLTGLLQYLDWACSPIDQRPGFICNTHRIVYMRTCTPKIPAHELDRMLEFFPHLHHQMPLDPSYEPTAEPHHPAHEADFALLQRFRAAGLIEPVGEEHLYYAAMNSKPCQLTPNGKIYWKILKANDYQ